MDVVFDGEELVGSDVIRLEVGAEPVLCILDLSGAVIVIVWTFVRHNSRICSIP